MKESSKYKTIFMILSTITLSTIAITYLINPITSFTTKGTTNQNQNVAIIVPGGGLTSTGELPIHCLIRVEKAIELFHSLKSQYSNIDIITLSGGTTHKPNPRDERGFPIWEATAAAKKLIELGIPSDIIKEEIVSLDTIGNAYYLRMIHIEPGQYSRLIVITNDWHMDRTRAIFDKVFSLPLTPFSKPPSIQLQYESVPSGIIDPEILQARRDREQQSLKNFQGQVALNWKSISDLYHWLYVDHNAYATKRLEQKPKPITANLNDKVLQTY